MTESSDDNGGAIRTGAREKERRQPVRHGATAQIEFTCPRCGDDVVEPFYGPCTACRQALGEKFPGRALADRTSPHQSEHGNDNERASAPIETWIDNL